MTDHEYIQALWERAKESIRGAEVLVDIDPNAAASRAYYAAYHAVSALFGLEGRTFKKHTDLLASVHRDLVHMGRWSIDIGNAFSQLNSQRRVGDYGAIGRISRDEAVICVERAKQILETVQNEKPELFSMDVR
jgi:uncharacterized protein (UPF0332 family)